MLAELPDDFRYVLGPAGGGGGRAWPTASPRPAGRPRHVNLHTAPGVGNGMGAIFNAQANKAPLLVTAGQQVAVADDAAGQPHQPRRHPHAASAREVELRAAARRGRAARASRAASTWPSCRRRARCSSRSRWTTGTPRSTTEAVAHQIGRAVDGRAAADPEAVRELAARLDGGHRARCSSSGPDVDASRRAGTPRSRSPSASGLPVWATPAPGGGRIGFPEDHPAFQGILPPAIGPLAETLAGHDLCSSSARRSSPTTPTSPARCCPRARAGGDHQRPRRGRARADGRRDRRRRRARRSTRCWPRLGDSDRDAAAEPPGARGRRRVATRSARRAVHAVAAPRSSPTTASSCSSRPPARSRCATSCACPARAATTSAPAAAWASASPRRSACSSRSPTARSSACSGEGSAQYAIQGLWTAAAYEVPVTFLVLRNDEYAILKWFAGLESVTGAPGARPARRSSAPASPRPTACRPRGSAAATSSHAALGDAIAADGPRLVEVAGGARDGAGLSAMACSRRTDARIGRPEGEPAADRAPDWVAAGTPEPLRSRPDRRCSAPTGS